VLSSSISTGPSSPHAQEFVVCSSSLRLFRASTQLPAAAAAAGGSAGPPSLSRQLSVDSSSDARTNKQWGVTVRAHSDYDAQGKTGRGNISGGDRSASDDDGSGPR